MAQAFGESRASQTYEARAEGIAADLADGQPPEQVRRFRSASWSCARPEARRPALRAQGPGGTAGILPGYEPTAGPSRRQLLVISPTSGSTFGSRYLREVEGPGDAAGAAKRAPLAGSPDIGARPALVGVGMDNGRDGSGGSGRSRANGGRASAIRPICSGCWSRRWRSPCGRRSAAAAAGACRARASAMRRSRQSSPCCRSTHRTARSSCARPADRPGARRRVGLRPTPRPATRSGSTSSCPTTRSMRAA